MAKPDWCHDRAVAIQAEISYLPRQQRAEYLFDLVGCLIAEAAVLVGREPASLALYALADTVVCEDRIPRRGAADDA